MIAPKHSPGPWVFRRGKWVQDANGVSIALVYQWAGASGDGRLPREANGDLMAGAFAMHEALTRIAADTLSHADGCKWAKSYCPVDECPNPKCGARAIAREVLALVRGGRTQP